MNKSPRKVNPKKKPYRPWPDEEPLGKALRDAYEHVRQEPLPEEWKTLLQRMREEEEKSKSDED